MSVHEASTWENARSLLDSHITSIGGGVRSRVMLVRFLNKWKTDKGSHDESASEMVDHLLGQDHLLAYLEREMALPDDPRSGY